MGTYRRCLRFGRYVQQQQECKTVSQEGQRLFPLENCQTRPPRARRYPWGFAWLRVDVDERRPETTAAAATGASGVHGGGGRRGGDDRPQACDEKGDWWCQWRRTGSARRYMASEEHELG